MINPSIGCRIERIRLAIHSGEYAFSRDVLPLLGWFRDTIPAVESSGW